MGSQIGVFISHTHADKSFARRLAVDLETAGVRVWIDEAEIQIGDSLIEKIRAGIDAMDYLAVVLSPESVRSEWVKREVDIAMNQEISGKIVKVLPLLYRQCDLPWFLEGKYYADFSGSSDYDAALAKVLKRLGLTTNSTKSKLTEVPEHDSGFRKLCHAIDAVKSSKDQRSVEYAWVSARAALTQFLDLTGWGLDDTTKHAQVLGALTLLEELLSDLDSYVNGGKYFRSDLERWVRTLRKLVRDSNVGFNELSDS